jgi:RHS repeat-associated protein
LNYYPFGETSFGGYVKKRYRFCGKEKDEESGLYYFGLRYLSPWTCRFITVDPMSPNTPGLSPYCYADCNPIMLNDPTGGAAEPSGGRSGGREAPNNTAGEHSPSRSGEGQESAGEKIDIDKTPKEEKRAARAEKRLGKGKNTRFDRYTGERLDRKGREKQEHFYNEEKKKQRLETILKGDLSKPLERDGGDSDDRPKPMNVIISKDNDEDIKLRAKERDVKDETGYEEKKKVIPPVNVKKDPDPVKDPDPIPVKEEKNLTFDIKFKPDTSKFDTDLSTTLQKSLLLSMLKNDPNSTIELSANTKYSFSLTAMALLLNRGKALRDWLISKGIDGSRVKVLTPQKGNYKKTWNISVKFNTFKMVTP